MRSIAAYFGFAEAKTSFTTETIAGVTTFMTMAYIIFLQPLVLTGILQNVHTGMDAGAVMVATCLCAALATLIMGVYARYPLAQAPGMGENFFFVTMVSLMGGMGVANPWQTGLGVIFISGVLFLILSLIGVRRLIMDMISRDMKCAMAAGIGLFIAFIGLKSAHFIQIPAPGVIALNHHFASPDILVFLFGLTVTAALHVRQVRGAIFWGILTTTVFATSVRAGVLAFLSQDGAMHPWLAGSDMGTIFRVSADVFSFDIPSLSPTLFKMDIVTAFSWKLAPFILIFLFMDLFDTIGTLAGVTRQANLLAPDGSLPRARQAFVSDAVATVAGAAMGTSTVTTFIESAAGIEQGGRTGFTSVVTAGLFLAALFLSPLVAMVGTYPAITAPALVIVGAMMLRSVATIRWDDYSEAIPCFLVILGIPLSFSIADGLAIGFIMYPAVKILAGRGREVPWVMTGLGVVLLAYFVFIRAAV